MGRLGIKALPRFSSFEAFATLWALRGVAAELFPSIARLGPARLKIGDIRHVPKSVVDGSVSVLPTI